MNEGAGDWICSDQSCGNINFARRASCYRCNKERPDGGKMSKKKLGTEIGKSAAEKSRGLFNADDWQCNKCANVNWARRTTCNVCNAPKFGEVEARTGYGGGYNERGVVEYRRREPSSDDEYDEFGRKKRKRKSETSNVVGITEGPVVKKLPPTLLRVEYNMDAMDEPAPNDSKMINRESDKVKGSLSDSSICDPPPLSKMAFTRNQLQNQTNYHRQNHMLPSYKRNGVYIRKRFTSFTDQDLREPLVSEVVAKRSENRFDNLPATKCFNVNNDSTLKQTKDNFVYKFTGAASSESYEVSYSIEERVKVAAFAIVHNNCKISTEKFEALYDKPAPDFKTIFAWRQRLLTTGCLVDSHISSTLMNESKSGLNKIQPNPEEIPISSDSDAEPKDQVGVGVSNTHHASPLRSTSAETLVICNSQKTSGSLASATEDSTSQRRNHSSPYPRTRSSSRDSRESNYADDLEKNATYCPKSRISTSNSVQSKQSNVVPGSESDTEISYDSDYVDFLSRVYGKGKKPRRKPTKRETTTHSKIGCESNNLPKVQGYCTAKTSELSPLASGNIYTSNVRNMQVKSKTKLTDVDGGSAEYVPTKLGSSTKKNYQEFKNNVKKKGFWAKGNCGTVNKTIKRPIPENTMNNGAPNYEKEMSMYKNLRSIPLLNPVIDHGKIFGNGLFSCDPIEQSVTELNGNDFTNDSFDKMNPDIYTSFDKSVLSSESNVQDVQSLENASRIFDVVQSNSASKNRSIMEIFDVFDDCTSPDTKSLEHNTVCTPYTIVWDEDDDALYKEDKDTTVPDVNTHSPISSINEGLKTHSERLTNFLNPSILSNNVNDLKNDVLVTPKQLLNGSECELSTSTGDRHNKLPNTSYKEEDSQSILSKLIYPHSIGNENSLYADKSYSQIASQLQTNLQEKEVTSEDNRPTLSESKKIHIIESLTIKPNENGVEIVTQHNTTKPHSTSINKSPSFKDNNGNSTSHESITHTPLNISNILAGINTDTLLLAIQNLQQLAQKSEDSTNQKEADKQNATNEEGGEAVPVETISLINDEDWEKESDTEESIERQLKRIHGSTGDTPFLSDIFDPGPVVIPPNVAKKLNINQNKDSNIPNVNESAPVIGNFKSFALPKPIMLNRLKLAIKQPDKNVKKSDGRPRKRTKKSKASGEQEEPAEAGAAGPAEEAGEEEESGDDADLSKYDLWGSDDEPPADTGATENKDGDAKEGGTDSADKDQKGAVIESKTKRRSRSSSTSSSSSSSSSSSRSSAEAPKNKFDDFNLNSERESSPGARRSRSPLGARPGSAPRRKRDSRSAGDSRGRSGSGDKERSRERSGRAGRDGRERARSERRERRYSRDAPSHAPARLRHR